MKKLKELTFKCDNHKCMIPKLDDKKDIEFFTFTTRDWCAQTGCNDGHNYIYVEKKCPKCGINSQLYYSIADLLHMLMTEEVEE